MPDLVPDPCDVAGLLPEQGLLVQQLQLPADQEESEIGPFHIGDEGQAVPIRGGSGGFDPKACDFPPKAPLARPGKGLGEHHLVVTGLHLADLDALEAVVLEAQAEGRIRQGLRLGNPLLLGLDQGLCLDDVRMAVQGF